MEYCFLKGFILVLLIQHCRSEGPPPSLQTSTVVTLQGGQASPQEHELPPAEVVPMLAPPSLEEVQQVVKEASQQVDGHGIEEVLKELLERVVEAALGQVDEGDVVNADGLEGQLQVEAEAKDAEKGRHETATEVKVGQAVEKEAMIDDTGITGGKTIEEHELKQVEIVAEEPKVEADVEPGGAEVEEVVGINDSPDTKVSQEVAAKTTLEETKGYEAVAEDEMKNTHVQVKFVGGKEAAETMQMTDETPAIVGGAASSDPEQETMVESDASLSAVDVERTKDAREKEESLKEETQVDEKEGGVIGPPSTNYKMEITQTGKGQLVEQEDKLIKKVSEEPEEEEEQSDLVEEEGATENVQGERLVGGAEGGKIQGENVINTDSVAAVGEGFGIQQIGEEEQIAWETFNGSEKKDEEASVISDLEPDVSTAASIQKRPGNRTPTASPSQVGVKVNKNTLGNEIITSTGDLLQHDLVVAQPTLENLGQDVRAKLPEGEEPGEASELVENPAVSIETSELVLETWKIGAIFASVLLVLETIVIVIYILKCRTKNGARCPHQACGEGCVGSEVAGGGDCSDDTLPADDGDAQQKTTFDVAQTKEQHGGECVVTMADLLLRSTEKSKNSGSGPDFTQNPRTSIL